MSAERFQELVVALCETVALSDPQEALERGAVEVDGFLVHLLHNEEDDEALYMNFDLGPVATIRKLRVYQLMLESNLTLYAQDQAQMGIDGETSSAIISVRVPMTEEIDGQWMAGTCTHYTEHCRYWRDNLASASDDMFNGLAEGNYMWMKP